MCSSIDSNVFAIHHGRRLQIEGSVILPTQIIARIPLGRAKITRTFRGSQKQSSGKKALIRIRLIWHMASKGDVAKIEMYFP
ncbi:MAG: hypothetical protein DMG45_26740 [Acidobacteria bacterium]|nr:MAG: hypothetical protein DMG45_26740 [Acidobacteriota bacterium]